MSMQRSITRNKLKNQRATRMGSIPTRYNDIAAIWRGVQKSRYEDVPQVKKPARIARMLRRLKEKMVKMARRRNRAA